MPFQDLIAAQPATAAVLMGCSSATLKPSSAASPLTSFLRAHGPCVVANLWDMTDRGIDHFTCAMLSHWLPENGAQTRSPPAFGSLPLPDATEVADSDDGDRSNRDTILPEGSEGGGAKARGSIHTDKTVQHKRMHAITGNGGRNTQSADSHRRKG